MNRTTSRRYRPELEPLEARDVPATYFVAIGGNNGNPGTIEAPFASIQHALNVANRPGDTVMVRGGTYREKVQFTASGNATGGPITLQAFGGERVVLRGRRVSGQNMVLISNVSHVRLMGFEIADIPRARDGSGVRVAGVGSNIEIRNNNIHDIRGKDAAGITVLGTSEAAAISKLVIDGNVIARCDPFESEALVLNGNVTDFEVTNNVVRNVNNIGIDLIGGERDVNPTQVARNGVVRGNFVFRANAEDGDNDAAGIYVDGGRDIIIEGNTVTGCDLGIEVGAENAGIVATGVTVRNNLISRNRKAGLVFGGFEARRGRVRGCTFQHNVVFGNGTLPSDEEPMGQLWIQLAEGNTVTNNIFMSRGNQPLLSSEGGSVGNVLDSNLWFGRGSFTLNGREFRSFAGYRAVTGLDANSIFADPQMVNPRGGDFRPLPTSPAVNAGSRQAGQFAPTDITGRPRPVGAAPDIGAFEVA